MFFTDQRAHESAGFGAVPHFNDPFNRGDEFVDKFVIYLFMNVQAGRSGAVLGGILEGYPHELFRRGIQICIFKNDDRVLAAKLCLDALYRLAGSAEDVFAGLAAAGETYHSYVRMRGQRIADCAARPGNNIDNACGQVCFRENFRPF